MSGVPVVAVDEVRIRRAIQQLDVAADAIGAVASRLATRTATTWCGPARTRHDEAAAELAAELRTTSRALHDAVADARHALVVARRRAEELAAGPVAPPGVRDRSPARVTEGAPRGVVPPSVPAGLAGGRPHVVPRGAVR